MKKYLFVLFVVSLSCAKKEEKKAVEETVMKESCSADTTKSRFKMYEMSEMSLLMEQMYVDNQRLKGNILKGDTIGTFPRHFLKINTAVMTDPDEKDPFFKQKADLFIKAQQLIFDDPKNAKQHFNEGVDACISCHQGKCGGPIPRIKKLYIK